MKPYDVTSTFVQFVDASPRQVLTRFDPMGSLADQDHFSALGLDDQGEQK